MSNTKTNSVKNHKLSELIAYYELYNKSEGKSPKTTIWYSDNLKRFQHYLASKHLKDSLNNIDLKLLREYVLFLMNYKSERGKLSSASIHGHVRTLRAFFNWLAREEFTETSLAAGIKPPKIVNKVITTLSDEEIKSILGTFNRKDNVQARDQVIFMILLDTGLRIGELINVKISDIRMQEGLIKVLGKGKKERIVPIGSHAIRALQRYLFKNRTDPSNQNIENVFLSVHGTPLTENAAKLIFKRMAVESGVSRLHAHLCRHTFATRYLLNGGDIFSLQQILGHSTLEMVRRYVNLASNHVALQHHKFSPLDRMELRGV